MSSKQELQAILQDVHDPTGHTLATTGGPGPSNGALVDRSGTVTAGGTAQQAMAANASRKYLLLVNPLTAAEQGVATAEDLWFNLTATATAGSPSIKLGPGDSFVMESGFVSTQALSVIGATTSHKWTAREG